MLYFKGMSNATPVKFTLSPSDQAIRVELPDGDTTYATLRDDGELTWHYGCPGEQIERACHEAVLYDCQADSQVNHEGRRITLTFGGWETASEMDRQCSARCQSCREVQASHNELSLHGQCTKCFVRGMAA